MTYRVLICDDSALARKMVKRSLPQGFAEHVALAEHGQQALSMLEKSTFDLLVLDLTMPVLDGIGVLKALKEKALDVLTIVVSGDIQPEMQKQALKLGAMAFISKPVDNSRLESTLKDFGFIEGA